MGSDKPERGGYKKGDETQLRVLQAALHAFGEGGFSAVSTRQLAKAAGVTLPAIKYYFGSKEDLYRACAEKILQEYRLHTGGAAAAAALALRGELAAPDARSHLKAVLGAVASLVMVSKEAETWAAYVAREMRDPGPAFELLYGQLWKPGVDLTAQLIARVLDEEADSARARVHAVMLISSLTAFQAGRRVSTRTMRWSSVGRKELAMVQQVIDDQIDALGPRTHAASP